jgi:hypothetical protein
MRKTWTVAMVLIAMCVAVYIVWAAWAQRPVSMLAAIAAAGYIFSYCVARIAEAWGAQLWEVRT